MSASPLASFFGDQSATEADVALANDLLQLQATYITDCMAGAGFDFWIEPAEVRVFETSEGISGSQAVERFGYDVMTNIDLRLEQHFAPLVSEDRQASAAALEELSADAQDRFGASYTTCNMDASENYPLPLPGATIPNEVAREVSQIQNEIERHPDYDPVWSAWADCLGQRGLDFQTRQDAGSSLYPEAEVVDGLIAALEHGEAIPQEVQSAIDRLAEKESELVQIDLTCANEIRLDDRLNTIRFGLESDALAKNGDRWTLLLNAATDQ